MSYNCGWFSSDFSVKFIPHQFKGIYVYWLCRPRHQMKNMLLFFAFNIPLAEFTSMLLVIILHEYKLLTHKPNSKWDHLMLHYGMIAGLIQFALYLVQIPDFTIGNQPPNTIRESCPCFMIDLIQEVAALSPTLPYTDPPIWPKDFELWFVSPKKTAILLYRLASQSPLTVNVDSIFHDIDSVVQ